MPEAQANAASETLFLKLCFHSSFLTVRLISQIALHLNGVPVT